MPPQQLNACVCDRGRDPEVNPARLDGNIVYYVECPACGRATGECATRQGAIAAWNEGEIIDMTGAEQANA